MFKCFSTRLRFLMFFFISLLLQFKSQAHHPPVHCFHSIYQFITSPSKGMRVCVICNSIQFLCSSPPSSSHWPCSEIIAIFSPLFYATFNYYNGSHVAKLASEVSGKMAKYCVSTKKTERWKLNFFQWLSSLNYAKYYLRWQMHYIFNTHE